MTKIILPGIAPATYQSRWVENHPEDMYHADKTHVSSTDLRRILKSPHAFYEAMADAGHKPVVEESAAFRFGYLFHMAILEPQKFFSRYVKMPVFKGVGMKAAKEEWLAQVHPEALVVTDKEFSQIEGMINSVLAHPDACQLLKDGIAEASGYYRDPETGIQCKIRPDFVNVKCKAIIDIKSTASCHIDSFIRSIDNYRYDFQISQYCEGYRILNGHTPYAVVFMAVEKTPPYEVALYLADDQILARGTRDYRTALNTLQQCLVANQWPKYQAKLQTISLPRWALPKEEEVS